MPPITAEEEFSKNSNLKIENIEHLRYWISKQPHLPSGITDEQLILFLHCCQHRLEDCKQVIETYYTIRTRSPEIFGNRDPKGEEVQRTLSIFEFAGLPKRDQRGNVVMVVRVSDPDANKFSHAATLKTYFMVLDAIMLQTGTVPGYVFVIDAKGCGFGHFTRIRISYMKLYADYLQEAFPGNVVATHLVNSNYFTKAAFAVIKRFCNTDMADKLFVHTSMDTLYDHVSKDSLPKEFGGNLDSMATYHKMTVEQLELCREWFTEEEAFRVDESKRPGKAKSTGEVLDIEDPLKRPDVD